MKRFNFSILFVLFSSFAYGQSYADLSNYVEHLDSINENKQKIKAIKHNHYEDCPYSVLYDNDQFNDVEFFSRLNRVKPYYPMHDRVTKDNFNYFFGEHNLAFVTDESFTVALGDGNEYTTLNNEEAYYFNVVNYIRRFYELPSLEPNPKLMKMAKLSLEDNKLNDYVNNGITMHSFNGIDISTLENAKKNMIKKMNACGAKTEVFDICLYTTNKTLDHAGRMRAFVESQKHFDVIIEDNNFITKDWKYFGVAYDENYTIIYFADDEL